MAYYDNEINILTDFSMVDNKNILLFGRNSEYILKLIRDIKKWNSSFGKNDPPPDFYSNEFNLMMDIMRVDDHTTVNKKGIFYNPYREKENKTYKEILKWIEKNDIKFSGNIHVNTITNLPTEEDHSYGKYVNEFKRVIEKHDKSYNLYKKNHPSKSLIYLIFDESSPYFKSTEENLKVKVGEAFSAELHLFFIDEKFISILKKCKADFIVWYAPFKHFDSLQKIKLPEIVVFSKNLYRNCKRFGMILIKCIALKNRKEYKCL